MRENVHLCRYDKPTTIQAYSIPAVMTGHDLIAIAQTGMRLIPDPDQTRTNTVKAPVRQQPF